MSAAATTWSEWWFDMKQCNIYINTSNQGSRASKFCVSRRIAFNRNSLLSRIRSKLCSASRMILSYSTSVSRSRAMNPSKSFNRRRSASPSRSFASIAFSTLRFRRFNSSNPMYARPNAVRSHLVSLHLASSPSIIAVHVTHLSRARLASAT